MVTGQLTINTSKANEAPDHDNDNNNNNNNNNNTNNNVLFILGCSNLLYTEIYGDDYLTPDLFTHYM